MQKKRKYFTSTKYLLCDEDGYETKLRVCVLNKTKLRVCIERGVK